jgi:hypothetical protein
MAATMSDVTVALATAPRTAVTTTIATATAIAGGGDRERARLIDRGADERDSDDRRERQHRPARQDRRRPPPVPRGPRRAAAHPHEGEPDEADDRDPESDGHPLLVDEVLVDHQVAGKAEADRFRAAELAALGGDPQGERNAHCDSGEGRGSDGGASGPRNPRGEHPRHEPDDDQGVVDEHDHRDSAEHSDQDESRGDATRMRRADDGIRGQRGQQGGESEGSRLDGHPRRARQCDEHHGCHNPDCRSRDRAADEVDDDTRRGHGDRAQQPKAERRGRNHLDHGVNDRVVRGVNEIDGAGELDELRERSRGAADRGRFVVPERGDPGSERQHSGGEHGAERDQPRIACSTHGVPQRPRRGRPVVRASRSSARRSRRAAG